MKNIISNTLNNRSVVIFGLLLVAFLYLTDFNYLNSSSENKIIVYSNFPSDFRPDTIPDTIPMFAVYKVSDTALIYLDGFAWNVYGFGIASKQSENNQTNNKIELK